MSCSKQVISAAPYRFYVVVLFFFMMCGGSERHHDGWRAWRALMAENDLAICPKERRVRVASPLLLSRLVR